MNRVSVASLEVARLSICGAVPYERTIHLLFRGRKRSDAINTRELAHPPAKRDAGRDGMAGAPPTRGGQRSSYGGV